MKIAILYNLDKTSTLDEYSGEIKEISKYAKLHNHKIILCQLDNSGISAVKRQLTKLSKEADIIFNLAEFLENYDSTVEWKIAKMMSDLGMIYTGADWTCLKTTINKPLMKKMILDAKIPSPKFQIFKSVNQKLKILYPVIVKAAYENASYGIFQDSVAENEQQLKKCVTRILKDFKQPALVEEYIDGLEFQVGIINKEPKLMISQVKFNLPKGANQILTFDGKWNEGTVDYNKTKSIIPDDLSPALRKKLCSIAKQTHKLFNSPDYSRVDFRVRNNKPYVLELNANHSIDPESVGFNRRLSTANLKYADFIEKVINLATNRLKQNKKQNKK